MSRQQAMRADAGPAMRRNELSNFGGRPGVEVGGVVRDAVRCGCSTVQWQPVHSRAG